MNLHSLIELDELNNMSKIQNGKFSEKSYDPSKNSENIAKFADFGTESRQNILEIKLVIWN